MKAQAKLQSIDKKITALKQRKEQVARQYLSSLARLIQKCGLQDTAPETLAGALQYVQQNLPTKQEDWRHAGGKFLAPLSKSVTAKPDKPKPQNSAPTKPSNPTSAQTHDSAKNQID